MGQTTPARRAFALLAAPMAAALLLPGRADAAPPPLQVRYEKIDCETGEVLVSITNPGPDAHEFTLYRDDDVIARGRSAANETVEESVRITRSARLKVHGDGEQVSERWIDACRPPATTRTAGLQKQDDQGADDVHHGLFDFGNWGQDREQNQNDRSDGGERHHGLFGFGKWGQDRGEGGERHHGLFDFGKWGQDRGEGGERHHGLFDFDKWGQGHHDHGERHHGLFDFGKWGQDHHDHHGGWWDRGDRPHGVWWNRGEHNWWDRDHHHPHDNWWDRDDHHGGWWDREDDHGPDHGGWAEREAENIGWWNRDRVHDADVLPYTGPPADLWGKVATAGGLVIMGGVFWWLARIWPRRTFPVTPR
ncbi:hypothetical protein [Herbidospora cretacea]|uniref:hypothetical protein n=1 Tax=Herbidospora cretacea TaxID=28444 RepID=UPI0004C3F546|nr:hypothetical protein [Herbidospora cretacea]